MGARQRARIKFLDRIPSEDRPLFAGALEMYGTVVRTEGSWDLVVMPNLGDEKDLESCLAEWANEGYLSWVYAN